MASEPETDPAEQRLVQGIADLKRFTSAVELDAAIAQIEKLACELAALSVERRGDHAAALYRACARAALELASGGSVFEAARLVRALVPHVGAVGGDQAHRWHFARAAVDVAVAGNDPELVSEIDRLLIPALDLAAVTSPDATPEGVAALYNLACLEARFGDRDSCLRYAELALERGSPPDEMRADPDFDPVASDPGFTALLARFDRA